MTYTLQHFQTKHVLGPVVMLWAIICAATAGVTTWQGLYAQRFFLGKLALLRYKWSLAENVDPDGAGFTESIIPTGFMVTLSGYYTQREQSSRQSWWFSGTGWFTIIGGAFNYGFAQIDGGALKPWQYIYVFAGVLTFLFGIWCFFLPNNPLNAWFLTPEERLVAVERLRASQTGVKNQTVKKGQLKEAILDIKIWLVALTMAAAYGPLFLCLFLHLLLLLVNL